MVVRTFDKSRKLPFIALEFLHFNINIYLFRRKMRYHTKTYLKNYFMQYISARILRRMSNNF